MRLNQNLLQQVNETSDEQYPFAIVLICIDSRTGAELTFDQSLGDIFSVRVAPNVINEDILGSMEFACEVAGSRLVVVLGHTRCGAVKGACRHLQLGHLTGLLGKIGGGGAGARPGNDGCGVHRQVALENTRHQMRPIVHRRLSAGRIGSVGGMYSVQTGEVNFFEQQFKLPAPAPTPAHGLHDPRPS